ncbi:ABC transporter ATP-binding protein [Lapillicoccus jejuensis]|uniref:Molybdate transport system ATP-binding protein n=1 Tax=Lapillicoccus jejuensis TaxID=402171 RepID=A0A542E4Y0_9MICO|nr:ABC transporter ATP-binding protein [Lapillicoccus jejuensis]TQJ10336.1 molybdate transport system ATP-binding protein [Lapillicoccus jejuensis]
MSATLDARVVVRRNGFVLDVELTAQPGEVVGVLGPNGAGKSTLLRALAGLQPLTGGRLALGGRVLDEPSTAVFVPPAVRPVGLVFQDYRLFPHLDALDNVAFGPRARGVRRPAARATAGDLLRRLGLEGLEHRRPAELSGGQAQRVALARALAVDPGLLLLDEPLAALDARTRLEVRSRLREHLRGVDAPVLVVTHDPLEAMVLADRLVVLEGGRVVQEGTPLQVARRPATQYVARLVGLNLWSGRLVGTGVVELEGGGRVTGTLDPGSGAREGDAVLAAVSPSAVVLSTAAPGPTSARNVWPGTVEGVELLTDRVRVEVGGPPHAFVDVTPAAVAELGLHPGQPVWLSAKATETDVYPAQNRTAAQG